MTNNLHNLFLEAEPHLVGIWKYRERGKTPLWYATIILDGEYFDISGSETIIGILKNVLQEVNK